MTIRNLLRNITALLFIGALSACQTTADTPPWDLPKPAEMTDEHRNSAIAAREIEKRLPEGKFRDPIKIQWDYKNDKNRTSPMSNMTVAALTSLITGKYHIRSVEGQTRWGVTYYAPDNTSHFCKYENGKYREWKLDRYIRPSAFGLAGTFNWNPKKASTPVPKKNSRSWPHVADSNKGLLYSYGWTGKKWVAERGWIQAEYAAAFAEKCPQLPRVSTINNNQLGKTFADLIPEATPVRGFSTAFKNNPEDPMTAEMYYWSYPPQ